MRGDVFRGHQQLLHRAAQSALQQHRSPAFSQCFQQHEILHVPRAHLHHVRVLRHQVHAALAHHFRNNRQPRHPLGFLQQFQSLFFHALKIVRRCSRLERAPAQQFRSCLRHGFGRLHDLLFRFHRAGPGHHHKFVAANFRAVHLYPRLLLAEFPAHKLVGRRNAHHIVHLRHRFDRFHARRHVAHAHHADNDALLPFDRVHFVAEVPYLFTDFVDLSPRRMQFHGNDHFSGPPNGSLSAIFLANFSRAFLPARLTRPTLPPYPRSKCLAPK